MFLTLLGASLASPLNLAWTGFWRANFTGSPWPGVASAGSSAGRDLSEAVTPPVGGATQNGYTPADFGGVASLLRTADPAEGTYLGATTCTIHAVVEVRSAPAAGTYVFDDPCIIVTESSATIALGVSSSGVSFGVYTSGGPVQTAYVALSPGYHRIQARLDGTNASVRVDGGAWTSVAATDIAADPTNVLLVGADYTGAAQALDAKVLELGVSDQAFSDTELNAVDLAAVVRYGLASKRCLVLLDGALRELPTSAPYGLRVILSGGALVTSVAGGKSLVVDAGALREATAGEVVLVPP